MKKLLVFLCAMVVFTGVVGAKSIEFNTVITWNDDVILQALDEVGFDRYDRGEIRVKLGIIVDLLKKKSFSLQYATQKCLNRCATEKSLEESRAKGLCGNIADALIKVNNRLESGGVVPRRLENNPVRQDDGTYKVYSTSGEYYAIYETRNKVPENLKAHLDICTVDTDKVQPEMFRGVVFHVSSNRPIALLYLGDDYLLRGKCAISEYASFDFVVNGQDASRGSLLVFDWESKEPEKHEE